MLFEEHYDKLNNFETYLKREDRMSGPTIITQVSQKSQRKSNKHNKDFNRVMTMMPSGHIGNIQTYPPLLYHQPNHDSSFSNN